MAEDSDTKAGGRNGKKEGVSGSSFFTWFMVIALLGVWTSVAVVWFDLVDYEEVLGKLGIYDADGDGDFDVDDAKVLLGRDPGGIAKAKSKAEVRDTIKAQLKKAQEKLDLTQAKVKDKGKSKKNKDTADKKKHTAEKSKKDLSKEKEKEKPTDRSSKRKESARSTSGREVRKEREGGRASRILAKLFRGAAKDEKKKGK